ncbi:MAG TPA: sialidase family protein [Actinophytocola sp.]|uniref:sialidase family protein n=1 Tax=Actinophytocola sp. TaxID=1872138 RepID=UPI002DDD8B98|nr:sialidase family protein [Actinophytocola sp.]HEV2782270.1 sialidase family protein [Actinophytocola sp.]
MRMLSRAAVLAVAAIPLLASNATAAVGPQVVVSTESPYAANCNGAPQTGTNFRNSEVEPFIAVNPVQRRNRIGVWQQDRWSNGGANGILARISHDGGTTWRDSISPPFSRCAGGNPRNGGDFERATDPWVSISPDGTAYFMSLSFNDSNPDNAMLVARSRDGGRTWGPITTLIRDGAEGFNDKNSLTADPTDSRFAYAVWDRLSGDTPETEVGPTFFTRTTDGGATWEPARAIHDPGVGNSTIGNVIAVTPDGTLINLFTEFKNGSVNVAVLHSTDKGQTWSGPTYIDGLGTVGVIDPRDGAPVRTGDIVPAIAVDPRPGHDEVYVVWQDARFTGFQNDSIVLSASDDGGRHWSPPKRVSPLRSGQAFTATVDVNADGELAVAYYDFTFDSPTDEPLVTDYWIVRSRDGGRTFDRRERMTSASFDMRLAPVAGGFFVGDYAGLDNAVNQFQAIYSITTPTASNPTDMIGQRATGRTTADAEGPELLRAGPQRPVLTATARTTRR